MTPIYRVSNLAAYSRWKDGESDDVGWLYNQIFDNQTTDAMSKGTAFHSALEKAATGNYSTVSANGYTFAFTCDAEIVLPKTREIRMSKDYGGIIVSGQCDGIAGRVIDDHKTSHQFDAEDHLEGWQHKFYLDIFDADVFRWHVWVMNELKVECNCPSPFDKGDYSGDFCPLHGLPEYRRDPAKAYNVREYHLLKQYRYPELEGDCRGLAHEFRDFATARGWNGSRAAA